MVVRRGALVAAALLVAACGSSSPTASPPSAPPSGAATVTPTVAPPTTTPTAAPDVAARFAASGDQLASGRLTYTGTLTTGTDPTPISGSATWDSSTNDTAISAGVDGPGLLSVETLRSGSTWRRRNGGPWVKAAAGDLSPLVSQLQSAAKLQFSDTSAGAAGLHTLKPTTPAAFDAGTFIPDSAPIESSTVDFALLVDEQGALKGATLALAFGASNATVEITFEPLGSGEGVVAPAAGDIWPLFTSGRWDASIAHPKGWTYEKGSDYDAWLSSGFPYFSFGRDAVSADADAEARKEFNYQKDYFNGKGTMVDAVLDGVPGHLITVKGRDLYYSANVVVYEVIAQVGKRLYWIFWESKQGNEAADLEKFQDIVSTFSFVN
jgi:hypothetical protein